ncbi:MAG: hypothetical protein OEX10_10135, partial [Candidatus Bathyarchaeota archaeon]|nr:hypothetical protein [Candidatus Bathyarchaeota archaeon]
MELEFYPPKSSITKRKNQTAMPIVTTIIGNQIAQLILLVFSSSFLELIPIRHRANLNQSSGYAWCYATPKGPDHPHETDYTT